MPKGAGRPENAPTEVDVVANVVTAVVSAIRTTVRRGTVVVVVDPGRARRTWRNKSGKTHAHRTGSRVHTHRHCRRCTPFPLVVGNLDHFAYCKKLLFLCFILFFYYPASGYPSAPLRSRRGIVPDTPNPLCLAKGWTR